MLALEPGYGAKSCYGEAGDRGANGRMDPSLAQEGVGQPDDGDEDP